jgi:hypothetical protein
MNKSRRSAHTFVFPITMLVAFPSPSPAQVRVLISGGFSAPYHLGRTWRTVFTVRRSELARWVEHEQLTGHSELASAFSTAVANTKEREN